MGENSLLENQEYVSDDNNEYFDEIRQEVDINHDSYSQNIGQTFGIPQNFEMTPSEVNETIEDMNVENRSRKDYNQKPDVKRIIEVANIQENSEAGFYDEEAILAPRRYNARGGKAKPSVKQLQMKLLVIRKAQSMVHIQVYLRPAIIQELK